MSNSAVMIYFRLLCVLKKAVANEWLNGTTEVVRDIERVKYFSVCLVFVNILKSILFYILFSI